jgi:hypothetical protein
MKSEFFLKALNHVDDKYIEEARENTMKKRFNFKPIIAIAACAALALAAVPVVNHFVNTPGVENPDENKIGAKGIITAFYAGASADSTSGIAFEKETDFDGIGTKFTDNAKVGTKHTVTVEGKTYTGTYVNSTRSDYYRDDTDNYSVYVDGRRADFSVNRETGVCTIFFVAEENIGTEITRDEAYAKAIAYLKEYVNDIENYTLMYEHSTAKYYDFIWYHNINGTRTSKAISVTMTKAGVIYAHALQCVDSFDNIDVSNVKTQKIENAVETKVKNTYSNYSDIKYSKSNVTLARLANGKYAFIYDVSVSGTNEGKAFTNFDKIVVEVE